MTFDCHDTKQSYMKTGIFLLQVYFKSYNNCACSAWYTNLTKKLKISIQTMQKYPP